MDRRRSASSGATLPLILGLLASTALAVGASHDCAKIRITNCAGRTVRIALGPVTLCAEVRVQPHPQHRRLVLQWDYAERAPIFDLLAEQDPESPFAQPDSQDGVIGSAEDDLDGEHEPILIRPAGFKLLGLSGGTYEVTARVYDDRGKICGLARGQVRIQ